jgi:DNA-binding transcriptional regulator YdaS (Cro superfamily)
VSFSPTTVAQTIEGVVRYCPSMSAGDIAEAIFGDRDRAGDLRKDLDWMWSEKILGRNQDGTYFPAREGPSGLNANQFVKPWA